MCKWLEIGNPTIEVRGEKIVNKSLYYSGRAEINKGRVLTTPKI